MDEYLILSLDDMLSQLDESFVKTQLSSFSCPKNSDVEFFIKTKAILFSQQGLSKTHLVYLIHENEIMLVGYFALTQKDILVQGKSVGRSMRDRLRKFATYDSSSNQYRVPTILIAQLGKNYANNYDKFITGDQLLNFAIDKVKHVQGIIGGKITYIECVDNKKLISFYKRNEFVPFGKRALDKDEITNTDEKELIQMLRYFKG